jgi:hypothetical protein
VLSLHAYGHTYNYVCSCTHTYANTHRNTCTRLKTDLLNLGVDKGFLFEHFVLLRSYHNSYHSYQNVFSMFLLIITGGDLHGDYIDKVE